MLISKDPSKCNEIKVIQKGEQQANNPSCTHAMIETVFLYRAKFNADGTTPLGGSCCRW